MSRQADLRNTFRRAISQGNISEENGIELFISVMGDVEYDIPEVNYNSNEWTIQEKESARKILLKSLDNQTN